MPGYVIHLAVAERYLKNIQIKKKIMKNIIFLDIDNILNKLL